MKYCEKKAHLESLRAYYVSPTFPICPITQCESLSTVSVLQVRGLPDSSVGKEFTCNAGDLGSIPALGRSPIGYPLQYSWTSLVAQMVRMCLQCRRPGFNSWVEKIPGGEHGNPLQYSCLENPHEQRSLVGPSPWGPKESNMTERQRTAHILQMRKLRFRAVKKESFYM